MSLLLNVGSGQRKFQPPWQNVDCNPKWNPDIVADGASMPMFADDSADCIVLHHSAEHMVLEQSSAAFREACRVLKPGGSLLVFVPDLDKLVRAWIAEKIDTYILCVNLHGAWMGNDADLHKWSYTHASLKEQISGAAKWTHVWPFDWRTIAGSDIARDWWILGMEAIK